MIQTTINKFLLFCTKCQCQFQSCYNARWTCDQFHLIVTTEKILHPQSTNKLLRNPSLSLSLMESTIRMYQNIMLGCTWGTVSRSLIILCNLRNNHVAIHRACLEQASHHHCELFVISTRAFFLSPSFIFLFSFFLSLLLSSFFFFFLTQ